MKAPDRLWAIDGFAGLCMVHGSIDDCGYRSSRMYAFAIVPESYPQTILFSFVRKTCVGFTYVHSGVI